jgi:hypothetical protein
MTPELTLLLEVWETVKPHVAAKERLHLAESLVRSIDDNLHFDEDADVMKEIGDRALRTALLTYFDVDDEDDEDLDSWE